jgi:hypothetical protein
VDALPRRALAGRVAVVGRAAAGARARGAELEAVGAAGGEVGERGEADERLGVEDDGSGGKAGGGVEGASFGWVGADFYRWEWGG